MPKGYCPVCDSLEHITPNGVDPRLSNKRQRVVVHLDKRQEKCTAKDCIENTPCPEHGRPLCDGSGRDI